ncbi:hypothetical protein KDA_50300 [Dictyobacter alpinus]|uniref:Xylose isomerase-like TIM barrel domain-containing protein n=1 Tax=Dictyobacter alpinus TaxID=2014873 RepID=A0A402BE13_9CHLR|nr:sugar phosphate isomerase/epimerase family protein [Dictyobacter alpinus]GCE29546.1 hypothetical protein KDA_50300 [Dictyobacter alpinus]
MKLAISGQLLSHTHDLSSIIDIFRSLEVDAIDLWPENIPGGATSEERARYEGKDIEQVRDLLQARQIRVACVTIGGMAIKKASEEGLAYATKALIATVDAAAVLGSSLVNCYLEGFSPDFFVEFMRPVVDYAASKNIMVALENEAHDASGTAEGLKAILKHINSPYFGTSYDPCNYYQANEEPFPRAYEILKEHIRYVHLKGGCRYDPQYRPGDHCGGTLRDTINAHIGYTTITDGVANADGILRRLVKDGYTGYITVEPHVPVEQALAYYRADMAYLHSRLQELKQL